MTWFAPGFENALAPLIRAFRAARWPEPPEGFELVTPRRRMRQVLRGLAAGPNSEMSVAIKWSRPVTSSDRLSRAVRGGKAAREGQVLEHLQASGIAAPKALATSADVLITEWLDPLDPVPHPNVAPAALVRRIGRYVANLHAAGVRHRDLTGKNFVTRAGMPVLIDAGGARLRGTLSTKARITDLARIRGGWLATASRTVVLRALEAYLEAWSEAPTLRVLDRRIARRSLVLRRRFLTGRDRRPTREGRHWHFFGGGNVSAGLRAALLTDEAWENAADAWLIQDPPDATALKTGGRVIRVPAPGGSGDVVIKRFDAALKGRISRPVRSLRRAEAFRHRNLPTPQALLAAADLSGRGLLVTRPVEATDLHAYMAGGSAGAFAVLPRRERTRVLRRIGRALRAMHDAEISHRDLKAPNLLVAPGPGGPQIHVTDLEGARIRSAPIPWSRRGRDLARLDASLGASRTDRLRVLRAYLRVPPWPDLELRPFLADIARRVASKRGPSNTPR